MLVNSKRICGSPARFLLNDRRCKRLDISKMIRRFFPEVAFSGTGIGLRLDTYSKKGERITENLDFVG